MQFNLFMVLLTIISSLILIDIFFFVKLHALFSIENVNSIFEYIDEYNNWLIGNIYMALRICNNHNNILSLSQQLYKCYVQKKKNTHFKILWSSEFFLWIIILFSKISNATNRHTAALDREFDFASIGTTHTPLISSSSNWFRFQDFNFLHMSKKFLFLFSLVFSSHK